MKHRLAALAALVVLALTLTGSALAFDCIRVSSSLQGLKQSTANGGNWYLFDLSSGASVQQTVAPFFGATPTDAQAACISSTYLASGYTPYFAIGTGVAGGNTNGPGVLAHNNPNESVLSNLKGIDHLDSSPIGAALMGAAQTCLA